MPWCLPFGRSGRPRGHEHCVVHVVGPWFRLTKRQDYRSLIYSAEASSACHQGNGEEGIFICISNHESATLTAIYSNCTKEGRQ